MAIKCVFQPIPKHIVEIQVPIKLSFTLELPKVFEFLDRGKQNAAELGEEPGLYFMVETDETTETSPVDFVAYGTGVEIDTSKNYEYITTLGQLHIFMIDETVDEEEEINVELEFEGLDDDEDDDSSD